jgi:adenylate cyclase
MAEERLERRLAAILAADVVGYSYLMGKDEAGTLNALNMHRAEFIHPTVAEYRGRIVKLMGDGALVEFPSVVDAVECAVAVQRGMEERNGDIPDSKRITFRIGINLGDIIIDGDDIYGDGVNVAARLEGLSEPGGICVSEKVFAEVRNKLDTGFEDLGPQEVKNIAEPVRAYRVMSNLAPTAPGTEPLPLPDKPSIAVLPFDNLSDDPEQEYFADGISEDIITALSKFRSFFVIARNSTFTYKGQAVDVTRVGKQLGVRYVLEGSVRKAGDRLRTTAQLIDAQNGNHVWAERYDGKVADILDLQDEITAQIVGALVPELDAAERARALRRPPEDVDTWVIFQRAMPHVDRFNAEANAQATTLLREVINRDPGFVPAYAHLAVLRAQAAVHGYAIDQSAAFDEAREYGQHAVSQDPNDAVAHLGLGIASMFRGEGDVAIPEIETAIELNPNFARAFVWLGFAHKWCRGNTPEIEVQYYDTTLRLSPRDPMRWFCIMHKGAALRVLGQHEEAVALCQAACRFPETGFLPLFHLTIALVHAGRTDEARDAAAELLQIRPELTITVLKRMLRNCCPLTLEPVLFGFREAGLPE